MRIFISWSKEPSKTVAETLRDWLPDVIQSLEPWMSSSDIGAGARWSGDIAKALAESKIGIICVTPLNQAEPWLNFEAGALAKTLDGTFVCPYLIGMRTSDLKSGPLTQFQAKTADAKGTWELIETINRASSSGPLPEERLRRLFDRAWPDLEKRLSTLPSQQQPMHRNPDEVLAEVLDTVRALARDVNESRDMNQLHWEEVTEAVREVRGPRLEPQEQVSLFPDEHAADGEVGLCGTKVEHKTFGAGIVLSAERGDDPIVTVKFSGYGPKRIKLRFLRVIGN